MVTSYLLTSTIVVPLYGKFGDLFGRKIVLQASILIFLAGSILCGVAQDMTQLIVLRALQGLGGGGLMVITMAAIADVIPPAERGRLQGLFGGVYGLATVVGPLLGGFIVEHLSWRWIFYINVPLGIVALVVIGARVQAAHGARETQDRLHGRRVSRRPPSPASSCSRAKAARCCRGVRRSCGARWRSG